MKYQYKYIVTVGILLLSLATPSQAAPEDILLFYSPKSPAPGSSITVEVKSYSFDADRANIQWFLNGKPLASGTGLTSQTITVGGLGSTMNINVSAIASGKSYSASLLIKVADIDIVVNPLTYIPPFYRGAPLASSASTVEIYAVPQLYSGGVFISSQNLVYEWELNRNKIPEQSGFGKNKIVLTLPDVGGMIHSIVVKVSDTSNTITAEKTAVIIPVKPQILTYESNPLLGRSSKMSYSYEVKNGSSISILAEPYYYDLGALASALISWSANGEKFAQPAGKNPLLLEIDAPPNSINITNFSLSLTNKRIIHQNAQASFNVKAN